MHPQRCLYFSSHLLADQCRDCERCRLYFSGQWRLTQLLLIAFTERSGNVRIISARLATRQEREDYEQNAL